MFCRSPNASRFLAIALLATSVLAPVSPAHAAGLLVFDPTNYSQTLLTAARSLQQINNQIQSLQNQVTQITQAAKNLSRIDFPQLQQMRQTMAQIDQLMAQAKGIQFKVAGLD